MTPEFPPLVDFLFRWNDDSARTRDSLARVAHTPIQASPTPRWLPPLATYQDYAQKHHGDPSAACPLRIPS